MNECSANLLLFAAGLGTRLKPATDINPKPTIPLLSVPMGYYLLPYLQRVRFKNFVINTFHLPEKVISTYKKLNLNILFSEEKDFIKGSGGGLLQAKNLLSQNNPELFSIITANADEIFFTDEKNFLTNALNQHQTTQSLATLIVIKHPEAGHKFGAIWTIKNKVVSIGKEKPSAEAEPWHFVGVQILSNKIFNHLESNKELNIFYDVLIHQLKTHDVSIYPINADWYETGNLIDYQKAKADIHNILNNPSSIKYSMFKSHFDELEKYPKSELSDLP